MVFIIQYSSSYYLNLFNPFIIYLHIIKRIAITRIIMIIIIVAGFIIVFIIIIIIIIIIIVIIVIMTNHPFYLET